MTRFRRTGLIVLCSLGVLATEFVDDLHRHWLTDTWGSKPFADAFVWTIITLVWMIPLLHPQVRRDVRFRPSRAPWTVLLLLPYPLFNVAVGQNLPVLRHPTETDLFALLAIYTYISLHAFWEELLLRGYALYQSDLSPRFAIIVSAIFFTLLHTIAKYPLHGLLFVFFLGLSAGLVRTISGGLAWPIVFHVATNLLDTILAPHSETAWAVICAATATISALVVLWKYPVLKRKVAVTQCDSDQHMPRAVA